MLIQNRGGVRVELTDDGLLLINGKHPDIADLGGGWFRASIIFCRVKRPKKASSCRKRKLALMAATKRYRFSTNFKRE